MADVDTCVCCGAPIPEGRMICVACEKGEKNLEEEADDYLKKLSESLTKEEER